MDHVATATKCSQIRYWSAPSPALLLTVLGFWRVIEKRRCTLACPFVCVVCDFMHLHWHWPVERRTNELESIVACCTFLLLYHINLIARSRQISFRVPVRTPDRDAAGRELVQEFIGTTMMVLSVRSVVKETKRPGLSGRPHCKGVAIGVASSTSEWGAPALLVPKLKGGWRLVIDLRELNKHILNDVYEQPPSCDLCLEWLAGKPYRTTADMRWGFHQLSLSEHRATTILSVMSYPVRKQLPMSVKLLV